MQQNWMHRLCRYERREGLLSISRMSITIPPHLAAEHRYRYQECLGILCEDRDPTPEQEAIARAEADAWVRKYMEKPDHLPDTGKEMD